MNKKVWIMNHYAGSMYFNKGGRHYWFADFLHRKGYEPVVFCSNSKHSSDGGSFYNFKELWQEHIAEEIGVPFVYIKACEYVGNGKQRVLNMIDFYFNLKKTAKEYAKKYGKPDVIYASSVHPLTLVAGIQLAKTFGVKCICEVRDLWPESLVAYGFLKKDSLISKLLYMGEKWIYKNSHKVIMTWAGGYDYIKSKCWDKEIPENKVVHIGNGVDLKTFQFDCKNYVFNDYDLNRKDVLKYVYTGSIRKVNNLEMIVKVAELLQQKHNNQNLILVWGEGDEKDRLEKIVTEKGLTNIVFKGYVNKKYIPSILQQGDISLLHNTSTELDIYGQSQNKFYEYLAVGNPILMTYKVGHSIVRSRKCGIEIEEQNPETIVKAIEIFERMHLNDFREYKNNCLQVAREYDFSMLTDKLVEIIEN